MKIMIRRRNHMGAMIALAILMIVASALPVNAATETSTKHKNFYGVHTDYGASVWGVDFKIQATYKSVGSVYKLTNLYTNALITPIHTFGCGSIYIAGIDETIDGNNTTSRSIAPTLNSFWSSQSVIVDTNTHVYYSLQGSPNKLFYSKVKEYGAYTIAVSNVYFASPNFTQTLNISL